MTVTDGEIQVATEALSPAERDVLLLLHAHEAVSREDAVRRTTLEAYTRLAAAETEYWAGADDIGVRRALSEALLRLRLRRLVFLSEEGFGLTHPGAAVVQMLLRNSELADLHRAMNQIIENLHARWTEAAH